MSNHYDVLELESNASLQDIKESYRKLSKLYHPDKNRDKSGEELQAIKERYMQIHKAYQVLSNEDTRREYDHSGITVGMGENIIDPIQAMIQTSRHILRPITTTICL